VSGLADLKAAIADQLRETYEGLTASDGVPFQVEPRYLVNCSAPTIDVYPGAAESREIELAGFADIAGAYILTVRFRITSADAEAADELITELLDDDSDYSLAAALLDDDTFGGYATSTFIRSFSGLRVYPDASGMGVYLGFEFEILTVAAHS
jgi:hypothetical protein